MDWQDIETAPKDGSIVTTAKQSNTYPAFKFMRFPYPLKTKFEAGRWKMHMGKGEWHSYEPQPTHWLPEPAVTHSTDSK